jgi:hypothetical protein
MNSNGFLRAMAVSLSVWPLMTSNAHASGAGTSAGPVTEAGESIGLAMGAALPEGLYFVDTASVVHNPGTSRNNTSGKTLDILVNIPVVVWSTPWTVAGGHIEAYAAVPEAAVNSKGLGSAKPYGGSSGLYNPAAFVGAAWALGNDFHFSNFVGFYAPVNQPGFSYANGTNNVWTFNERAALSYLGNGYNLTAHMIYGHSTSTDDATQTNAAGTSCALVDCQRADYLNVDLTALKTIGKWDLGPVAYYTTDLTKSSDSQRGNKQFALGGLVGHPLGDATVQAYVTHDVWTSDGHLLGGKDTRFFLRLVAPLWNPSPDKN